jgi:hypothetical protein
MPIIYNTIYNNGVPKHLGGHGNKTHIDENTLNYLIKQFNIKSLYDIGCGPGGMVVLAKGKGIKATGIDGDSRIKFPEDIDIIIHDFTMGSLDLDVVDLGWSCEFLEHVEEKYAPNYFSVFIKCKIICCTFATTGGGYHHVNVQNQYYWDKMFSRYGFKKDYDSTHNIKKYSSMKRNFIRNTGTVYINTKFV